MFKLPSGKSAKVFILELTHWLEQFNRSTEYQCIALKVFMVLPCLMLKESKSKEHCRKLEERISAWKEGRIHEILLEGRVIQQQLNRSKRSKNEDMSRNFAKLVFQGKINAALKLLSSESDFGVHQINDDIINELRRKHPDPSPIQENTLLNGPINFILPSYFDSIDENMVLKATQLTKGAGGPSQLDAEQYSHILTSTKYKKENKELRDQIALLARKLASEILDPKSIE